MALPTFQWSGNQAISTPEAAERRRRVAEAMIGQAATPASNWAEGLSDVAAAFTGTQLQNQAAAAEEAGRASAAQTLAGLGPNAGFSDIAGALSNPWLSQPQSTIAAALLQQNLQSQDPAYQLELEMKRAQLAQLQAPPSIDPTAGMQNYNFLLSQGYDPQEAAGMSFGAPSTTINNNMGGEKFGEEFAKLDAQTIAGASAAGIAAQRNLPRIQQLEALLNSTGSGATATMQQLAGNLGFETEGLGEIQAAQAIINSLVPEQRQPGSGPMSDADLALFKESLPRIINAPGGNQLIIRSMKAIAEYDALGAEIANMLRTGQIDRATAFAELQNRPHPLAEFYNAGLSQTQSPSPTPNASGITIRRIE